MALGKQNGIQAIYGCLLSVEDVARVFRGSIDSCVDNWPGYHEGLEDLGLEDEYNPDDDLHKIIGPEIRRSEWAYAIYKNWLGRFEYQGLRLHPRYCSKMHVNYWILGRMGIRRNGEIQEVRRHLNLSGPIDTYVANVNCPHCS